MQHVLELFVIHQPVATVLAGESLELPSLVLGHAHINCVSFWNRTRSQPVILKEANLPAPSYFHFAAVTRTGSTSRCRSATRRTRTCSPASTGTDEIASQSSPCTKTLPCGVSGLRAT